MVFSRGESLGASVAGACARIFGLAFVVSYSAAGRGRRGAKKRNAASDQEVRRKKNAKNNLTKRAEKNSLTKKRGRELRGGKRGGKSMKKRENFGDESGEKRDNQKRSALARRKERKLRKEKKSTVA